PSQEQVQDGDQSGASTADEQDRGVERGDGRAFAAQTAGRRGPRFLFHPTGAYCLTRSRMALITDSTRSASGPEARRMSSRVSVCGYDPRETSGYSCSSACITSWNMLSGAIR